MLESDILNEIEMNVALLAIVLTPALAAERLRAMADEIAALQPKEN